MGLIRADKKKKRICEKNRLNVCCYFQNYRSIRKDLGSCQLFFFNFSDFLRLGLFLKSVSV